MPPYQFAQHERDARDNELQAELKKQRKNSTFNNEELTGSSFLFFNCAFYGSKITSCKLRDCTIVNCELKDCIIIHSDIRKSTSEGSTITDATILDCKIYKDNLIKGSWARDCEIQQSYTAHNVILRSRIHDSEIVPTFAGFVSHRLWRFFEEVQVRTSVITSSTANNVNFNACTIEDSTLQESTLHHCKLTGGSKKDCTSTRCLLPFRELAPELRVMIYGYVDLPTLMAAFRCDPLIHGEIMAPVESNFLSKPFKVDISTKAMLKMLPTRIMEKVEDLILMFVNLSKNRV